MSRRGENIFKRKDGRWEARFIHHYEEGKAKYRYLYGDSYAEVRAKRDAELAMPRAVIGKGNKQTANFKEIADLWLADIQPNVKEATYTRYYRNVYVYLLPELGDKSVSKISCQSLKDFTNKLMACGGANAKPLSAKTVGDILCVLKAIMRFGRTNGYACADLDDLSYPKKTKNRAEVLPEDVRIKIENRLWDSEDCVSLGILFTLYTGVRIGELCGLQWGDFDFGSGVVYIRRTIERISDLDPNSQSKTKVIISEPKTENSQRIIPLPDFLATHMKRFVGEKNHYVITGTAHYSEPHLFYLRYKTFLKNSSVPEYSFHTLRHTFATRCVEHGFDTKSLSDILGHSNIATTLSLYVHPTIEQKRKQMERLSPAI